MAPFEPSEATLRIVLLPDDGPERTECCNTRKGGDILAGYLEVFSESLVGVNITVVFQGACMCQCLLRASLLILLRHRHYKDMAAVTQRTARTQRYSRIQSKTFLLVELINDEILISMQVPE